MKKLLGTEKQVIWAEKLRVDALLESNDFCDFVKNKYVQFISEIDESEFFIDNRSIRISCASLVTEDILNIVISAAESVKMSGDTEDIYEATILIKNLNELFQNNSKQFSRDRLNFYELNECIQYNRDVLKALKK